MASEHYSVWDKVIYSLFSMPIGIVLGILGCWLLSNIYPNLTGFFVYVLAALIGIGFTTFVSFVLPSIAASVLTFIVKL